MTDQPSITPDPNGDGVILHLPNITYLDTQAWSVDIGLTHTDLAAFHAALAISETELDASQRRAVRLVERIGDARIWARKNLPAEQQRQLLAVLAGREPRP